MSLEDDDSFHSSSTNSVNEDTVNYGSSDSRLATNSPAVRQSPFTRSPYNSVELGGPDEKTRLLN